MSAHSTEADLGPAAARMLVRLRQPWGCTVKSTAARLAYEAGQVADEAEPTPYGLDTQSIAYWLRGRELASVVSGRPCPTVFFVKQKAGPKRKVRDPQRSRVYAWENFISRRDTRTIDAIEDAWELAYRCLLAWYQDAVTVERALKGLHIRINPRLRANRGECYGDTVTLCSLPCSWLLVAHETAHWIAWYESIDSEHHNAGFVERAMLIYSEVLGYDLLETAQAAIRYKLKF